MARIHLIRHGAAGNRRDFPGDDAERPLTPKGLRQAHTLAQILTDEGVRRVVSSPAVRCRQTVEPLAAAVGAEVEEVRVLREGADPAKALALLERLATSLDGSGSVAACTHGDVMPEVVRLVQLRGAELLGPTGNNKASWWTLEHHGRFTVARWNPPA